MSTKNVRMIRDLLLLGVVLLALFLFSPSSVVFAADPYFFIFTGADSVICSEPTPDVGEVTFNVTANYSLLPDASAGTQEFIRKRQVDGVTYATDGTGFTVYGAGIYMSGTSHPPFAIPPGATSYTFTLEELLIVDGVETSITAVTVRCDELAGVAGWIGTFVGVTGDRDIDVNNAPVAIDDVYTTLENTALSVAAPGVLGNDSDPDGDALAVSLVIGPANGTLVLNSDGSFDYTPNAGFSGVDSFDYEACDSGPLCDIATVWLEVVDSGPGGPPSDPGDVVPDNPANAGEHSNPHACADNPGRANEHRPDNAPPC